MANNSKAATKITMTKKQLLSTKNNIRLLELAYHEFDCDYTLKKNWKIEFK